MIDKSCGLPYHDERGEVQDCTCRHPCRKCLEAECARLMRETPVAYVVELTAAAQVQACCKVAQKRGGVQIGIFVTHDSVKLAPRIVSQWEAWAPEPRTPGAVR